MGIKKINLQDLSAKLAPRGRDPYKDGELFEAFMVMLEDGQPFHWDTAIVEGKDNREIIASKAKWRNRAVSVFDQIETNEKISIHFGLKNELFIILKV